MKKEENIGVNDLEPFVLSLEKLGEKKLALQVLDAFAKQSKQFLTPKANAVGWTLSIEYYIVFCINQLLRGYNL